MPMKRHLYPDNWEEISYWVKANADWKCQHCGKQCRRPGEPFDTHKQTLTTAHLDHDPHNPKARLAALCAPCHLRYDAVHHAKNAAATRAKRKRVINA